MIIHLSRRTVVRLAAVLVLLLCFIGTFLTPRSSGFEGTFFYPLTFFYTTWLHYVVTLFAFAVLLRDLPPLHLEGPINAQTFSKGATLGLVMLPCACSVFCAYIGFAVAFSYSPLPAHFESIVFDDHLYYLAWDRFGEPFDEDTTERLIVYRCDSLGMLCNYNPENSFDGRWRWTTNPGERTVGFVVIDNQLYVQVNDEWQYRVHTSDG